jgi:UMF1 family MFS transporter
MVGVANAVASALVALSIPVFGAISDLSGRRKPWVIGFTIACCIFTALIGMLGHQLVGVEGLFRPSSSSLILIALVFVAANYCYQGALPFYNAMMPELAPAAEWGKLSGLGTALGYIGSIAGVLMIAPFFNNRLPIFGEIPSEIMRTLRAMFPFTQGGGRAATFVPTAILFLLFSLPFFLFCRDHIRTNSRSRIDLRHGFRDVAATLRNARQYPGVLRLIVASLLYQDAMGTIIANMALYAVAAVGFTKGAEITLFVVLTIPAVIGSYILGRLTDLIGPKRTLVITLMTWVALLIALVVTRSTTAFWIVGALIGLIYGGVGVAERPLLLSMIPDREAGQFFSLLVLSARVAAIAGPLIWGLTVDTLVAPLGTAIAYRAAVLTVTIGFLAALFLLRKVPDRHGELRAHHA